MASTSRMIGFLEQIAVAKSHISSGSYRFVPAGQLIVDDRDTGSLYGELYYDNTLYEIGAAVKVRDWIFALERMTTRAKKILAPQNLKFPNTWVIGAFYEDNHYNMTTIESSNQDELNRTMVTWIVERTWAILHPEVFDNVQPDDTPRHDDTVRCLKWELLPNKPAVGQH